MIVGVGRYSTRPSGQKEFFPVVGCATSPVSRCAGSSATCLISLPRNFSSTNGSSCTRPGALSPPPQDSTLALRDTRSLYVQDRVLSTFTIGPRLKVLEFHICRYDAAHRWFYFPDMRRLERGPCLPDTGSFTAGAFESGRFRANVPMGGPRQHQVSASPGDNCRIPCRTHSHHPGLREAVQNPRRNSATRNLLTKVFQANTWDCRSGASARDCGIRAWESCTSPMRPSLPHRSAASAR